MSKKSENQLAKLFENLRLMKYLDNFTEEEVIYDDLKTLSGEDLKLLIPKDIPRRRLLRYLYGESAGTVSTTGSPVAPIIGEPPEPGAHAKPQTQPFKQQEQTPSGDSKSDTQTEFILVQGLVQTAHLNGIYLLQPGRFINNKVWYQKRVGKAVLSWQLKPQWKVLKNGDWVTPSEGTGIWYISQDFESDLMVYMASSQDCPFMKRRDYDGVIWEWNEQKEQWVKAKSAEISALQSKVRVVINKLRAHEELNGTYEMVLPQKGQDRPQFLQVEPHRKGVLHWKKREDFSVMKDSNWVKPEEGVGLWMLSLVGAQSDMCMYFCSNELMPFFKPLDYDGCKWEWLKKKSRFVFLKNFDITRKEKFNRQEVTISGIEVNRELNGVYIFDGTTNEGKQVYKKRNGDFEAFLFWTHKKPWSTRINNQWCKPEEGVGIWNISRKLPGKILCYFASNETSPYEKGDDYDQIVWEWNADMERWKKLIKFKIKITNQTSHAYST